MVQRERIAENVYSFQSELYAQVTCGAVVGPNWAVVIDTLAVPEETLQVRDFIEQELNVPVRYVINTHYHADHAWGNCFFYGATIIAHKLCRQYLETRGIPALKIAQERHAVYQSIRIVLPHLTFERGRMNLRVGKKTLTIFGLPGHSKDNLGVLVEEDKVLFASDAGMALPYIVDGDFEEMVQSLKLMSKMGLENIIQGHGDIVLRGEIDSFIKENLAYLAAIKKVVRRAALRKYPMDLLEKVSVEECGKSRVLIGGLAEELHRKNLIALYKQLYGKLPERSPQDEDYEEEETEEEEE
ncbi:MAG: MBL fold metallo-hydrolase [Anaerolineales bacterium]|nr:MBL fold metallo-hydrolase [Anaerolineales bacterium]MCS7248556.1 MBL fold metallo-hydrolase [Anaerolineales bacterium]MDW8162369.1 MBL fold metallo-hydrolase [Anaerolineales bacterium]MDW8448302.1 MBL fold metallo-hydrolase [Anaerolineales bacterium]